MANKIKIKGVKTSRSDVTVAWGSVLRAAGRAEKRVMRRCDIVDHRLEELDLVAKATRDGFLKVAVD
jgi:hypothetical protein